jgi:type IV pilus assembly protein PilB
MEKRPKFIGEILADLGLITQADVDRALAFQRERGGYFGEALVELGIISAEQLNFGLADQFDLPFVHLRPESIDRDVARMVPPEWARERLILPVLLDGQTVTAIVARPPADSDLATVQRFTCAGRVQAAISTADTIRSLIAAVHQDGCGEEISVMELLERAGSARASLVGISARGGLARGWFRGAAGIVRCCVRRGWDEDLRVSLSPIRDLPVGSVERWPAILSAGARARRVDCAFIRSAGGVEWTLDLGMEIPLGTSRPRTDEDLAAAVLDRVGGGILIAAAGGPEVPDHLLELMVPLLPATLIRPAARTVHITDRPVATLPDVMSIEAGRSPKGTIAALAALDLDAITLDLDRYDPDLLAAAGAAAPMVVVRAVASAEPPGADLYVALTDVGDSLRWMLSTPTGSHGAN